MNNLRIATILRYILVIGVGALASWQFRLFSPYSSAYPPSAPYSEIAPEKPEVNFVKAAPGRQYERGWLGEFWLGKHYRLLWATPVKVKVLNLEKAEGGLRITKRGGGMQTTSFSLVNKSGQEFSLRSVDKDPVSVVPAAFWSTAIAAFIRDQVSATDPYALQPVLALSQKAGLTQGNAQLVFVLPNDPAFKKFGVQRAGFYNLMPKYNGIVRAEDPKKKVTLYSTPEMLQLLKQDPKNSIDTTLFLRCRLFDLFIGDWDRHAGQWDWVAVKTPGGIKFKPIPKDRDQAFGYYADGVLPYIFSRNFAFRKITSFTPRYQDITGFSQNGSSLDDLFLKTVPFKLYKPVIADLQLKLNDQSLREAINHYPKPVIPLIEERLFNTLKSRRELLPEAAREFSAIIRDRE